MSPHFSCPQLEPDFYFSGLGLSTKRMQQRGATQGRGLQDGESPGEGARHPHPHLESLFSVTRRYT